ncbi:LPS-assembly protein LptD [Variovorax terrae]|uniref:LPS-assembly protein LptD n=1 Tax=Variovorax terrae TaxID=2923278 RepID=A0A9X1VXP9_9BURK|nr:LPS-assembly protein LptD [Variovorax terrae]MCJ0765716.1 LPS-assembly protein LptD [Variovorax terrae]
MHDLKRQASRSRFALTPVALVAVALLHAGAARAQAAAPGGEEALTLRRSPLLKDEIPAAARKELPTFLSGDHLSGRPDLETVIDGHAELRRGDTVIRADRLDYYQPDDLAKARGNVHINRAGNVYEGPSLDLKLDAFEGFFNEPRYHFLKNDAYGEAERIDFIDDKRAIMRNASYTTCQRRPGPSWMPDWILRAASISLDNDSGEGVATGATLSFKGVPILPIPSLSFPLNDGRKSGFLPPTVGPDSLNGLEVTAPYYWNIAPNRDATLFPTLMTKRGVSLGGEFRYLEPLYRGQLRADYMPTDTLRDRQRWGYAAVHSGGLETGITGLGTLGLNLNLNRVSDSNYWRDFPRTTASLTQRLLPSDASMSWAHGDFFATLRTLNYQTLQDVTAPIVPPYNRLPQLAARYARVNVGGFDFSVDGDYTQFQADPTLTLQPNAKRTFALAQISRPWLAPGWFVTPKLQMNATNYQFQAPLANGATTASRVVPTFSLDSGLVFERNASYFGRAFRQTLEPRAFYVYTPFRDQSLLPVYDTAANDYNFATVYTENAFSGNDRIADNNLLTLGVTTRLLDPDSGAEAARFGIAQRLRFKPQNVTLPGGTPVADGVSDLLLGATVNWSPKWMVDSTVQFNPQTHTSTRSTIGARYNPGNYRVFNVAYRLQRGTSEQIDVGWQWPINDLWGQKDQDMGRGRGLGEGRWYSVGRLNYSMYDRRLVDAVIGFEYDAGCWLGRVVLDRTTSGTTTASTRILFQLEFVGFARVGSSPLQTLKQSIPRYQYLREQVTTPSRFSNYD